VGTDSEAGRNFCCRQHGSNREASPQAFGAGENIWHHTVHLVGKKMTRTAHSRLDLVKNEQDGLLFASENDQQLSEQLLRLINDASLRETLANAAHQKVVANYQLESRNQRVFELYDELLAKKLSKA
jgi:hypothetical protein